MDPIWRELAGLWLLIIAPVAAVWFFGSGKPSWREVVRGLICAVVFSIILILTTTVLLYEGSPLRHYLLYFLGALAIFSLIQPLARATAIGTLLLIVAILLCFQHLSLCTQHRFHPAVPDYTDTPSARLKYWSVAKKSAAKKNLPPPNPPRMEPEWHTPLTGLYRVY